jgi:hypothetical protein
MVVNNSYVHRGQSLIYYLKRHPEIENVLAKNSQIEFLITDLSDKFKRLGSKFFGKPINPQKASL